MILVYIGIAWLIGIYLSSLFAPSPIVLASLGLLSLAILFLGRKDRQLRLLSICALALLLGSWRYSLASHVPGEGDVDYYNDRGRVVIQGLVVGEPDVRDRWTNLRLEAESLTSGEQERAVKGKVLVRAARYPEYRYGDRLKVEGSLEAPPVFQDFSYQDYLARQGIYSMMYRPQITLLARERGHPFLAGLYAFKARAQEVIAQILPEPQGSLLTGILLGVERGIPRKLMDSFNATSTSHVIAISGFNLSLLSGIFAQLGRRLLGRRFSVLFAIGSIILYTLFVGANTAVVRAAIMSILYVIAIHYRRRSEALTALIVSGVLMTLLRPQTLFDIGFQLSFAATLGLILYTPLIENGLARLLSKLLAGEKAKKVLTALNDVFTVTLASQLFILPIVVYYFKRLSLIGQLTNFLVLPAQSGVMVWGGIATLLGLLYLPLGQIAGWVAWLFLTWTIRAVEITAQVPYTSLEVKPLSPLFIWLYYGLLLGLWLNVQETYPFPKIPWRHLTRHLTAKATLLALSGAAILTWSAVFSLPDGYLHVVFFDVGQGDAIFIESPQGTQILVDGGPSPMALLSALGEEMPFWDRSIDMVVITHPDEDHIAGLVPVLERYHVGQVLDSPLPYESATARRLAELMEEKNIPRKVARAGMRLNIGDNIFIEVLNPGERLLTGTGADDNNNSLVLRLSYGRASVLLTGDAEEGAELRMTASHKELASLVLKVSHHGAKAATGEAFLDAVQPEMAVIQVGADNRFGHPAPEVLARLEGKGAQVLRTDVHGKIEFITDGQKYWVETAKSH
ncbi:MAG: DNA internalization-related competence protein ComEC/Rec2 [Anaerolineae bacterium]